MESETRLQPAAQRIGMARTRIGFIGAGIIAHRHVGDLLGFPDVAVAAVADPRLDRATELATRCGAAAYDDPAEMLARERLDALYICAPPFAHGVPERLAIEHGLPFFVQKPLAVDRETAEEIALGVRARDL